MGPCDKRDVVRGRPRLLQGFVQEGKRQSLRTDQGGSKAEINKNKNRFDYLSVEETDSDSSTDSLSLTSEATPSERGRDDKPVLHSSNKKEKVDENPDIYVRSVNLGREIIVPIQIAPQELPEDTFKIEALLDSGANTIFIDKKWF